MWVGQISPLKWVKSSALLTITDPCAGYVAHPLSKETVFTLEFRRCDPSFPVIFPGSRSLQEGHGCLDHDGFPVYSPSAIHLLSRYERNGFPCSTCWNTVAHAEGGFFQRGSRLDVNGSAQGEEGAGSFPVTITRAHLCATTPSSVL